MKTVLLGLLLTATLVSAFEVISDDSNPIESDSSKGISVERAALKGGEDHGKGITEQDAQFIKARIIEVAKTTGQRAESNAENLQMILSAKFGGTWGVVILGNINDCYAGIRVGIPLQDKWFQIDKYGPYEWFYGVWKQRYEDN